MKLHESSCHDPATNHDTKANTTNTSTEREELSGDQRIRTNTIHMEAPTRGNNISSDSRFPIYQNPFFTYYLHWGNDYKTGWKGLCYGMYYILGGLLDGIGSACMSCCREFEGYGSVAWFGKKAGEIKRNDVAHLVHLYSISSPQTAGPGCRDERLSGGQERRSWVRRKMASRLSHASKRNPTPLPQFLGLDVLMKALSLWIVG